MKDRSINFGFLSAYEPQLDRLGASAEHTLHTDPNTCLIKLRQFGDLLARKIGESLGCPFWRDEKFFNVLSQLESNNQVPANVLEKFHLIRQSGNDANHAYHEGFGIAHRNLKLAYELGLWFYVDLKGNSDLFVTSFVLPQDPEKEIANLRKEVGGLIDKQESKSAELKQLIDNYQRLHDFTRSIQIDFKKLKKEYLILREKYEFNQNALKSFLEKIEATKEYMEWAGSLVLETGEEPTLDETLAWILDSDTKTKINSFQNLEGKVESILNDENLKKKDQNDPIKTSEYYWFFFCLMGLVTIIWLIILNK